jgi:uncharacterized protein (TIGR00369 family)
MVGMQMKKRFPIDFFKDLFENQIPFNNMMGLELLEADRGYVKVRLPFRESFIGDFRRKAIHGGVISGLMDNVGGAAAMSTMNHMDEFLATVDLRIDYLEPGYPEDIIAEGHVIRSGKNIIVTKMTAYQHNRLIAEGRGVFYAKRKKQY